MTGWCPNKGNGTLEDSECHFDGYCSECLNGNKRTESADVISRQAAIDAIDKAFARVFVEKVGEETLRDVPSVQSEIVRCKDCTFYRSDGCFFSTAEIEEDHIPQHGNHERRQSRYVGV